MRREVDRKLEEQCFGVQYVDIVYRYTQEFGSSQFITTTMAVPPTPLRSFKTFPIGWGTARNRDWGSTARVQDGVRWRSYDMNT